MLQTSIKNISGGFGGVSKVSGSVVDIDISSIGISAPRLSESESISFRTYIAAGALQSFGPMAVADSDGVAFRIVRTAGQPIVIDEANYTVIVDSNVSIRDLDSYLRAKGYSFPVMPGAEDASIGGCIAADVHGKNGHKFGSFGDHVVGFSLFDPFSNTSRWVTVDDSDFCWTIGGFGVTGVILIASLKIIQLPGHSLLLRSIKCNSLQSLIDIMIANADSADDIGGWFSPWRDKILGKVFVANWSQTPPIASSQMPAILSSFIFMILGLALWRRFSSLFLSFYIYIRPEPKFPQIPTHVLFPLAGLVGWNKFFGKSFVERQFVVPLDQGVSAVETVLALLRHHRVHTPLCAVKIFKGSRVGPMSFANEGISFSIQYETRYSVLDAELTAFLKLHSYPEYLAKVQQTSTGFPAGYRQYEQWFALASKNKVNSILINWLRNESGC